MFLIINTADSEKFFLALAKKEKIIFKKEFFVKYRQTEKLLPEIGKLFKKYDNKTIKGIIVVSGPGSFTSLRIGITVANTLSWALNIPICAVKLNEFNNSDELIKMGNQKLKKIKGKNIIYPFYGQEPNITIKNKL